MGGGGVGWGWGGVTEFLIHLLILQYLHMNCTLNGKFNDNDKNII